jgi:hypothetical protein
MLLVIGHWALGIGHWAIKTFFLLPSSFFLLLLRAASLTRGFA